MANTACQPIGTNIFNADNRKQCEKYVSSIQRKLDKAVADNNKSNIRWYTQKEKVVKYLRKVQEILDSKKTATQHSLINILNPMQQGYGMYNRFAVSQETFSSIDCQLWQKLWKWAKRRHPNKSVGWIKRKYFTTTGRKWVFKDGTGKYINIMSSIPIVRFTMIKSGMRVHDRDADEYWIRREYTNALSQVYSIKVERLMKRQKGICPCCGNPITRKDIAGQKIHAHHMLPRSEGGTEKPNNLQLLHQDCHVLIHQVLTRKEMAYWMKKRLNYTTKSNIVYFQKHPNVTIQP